MWRYMLLLYPFPFFGNQLMFQGTTQKISCCMPERVLALY
jgi:hypothetical protein